MSQVKYRGKPAAVGVVPSPAVAKKSSGNDRRAVSTADGYAQEAALLLEHLAVAVIVGAVYTRTMFPDVAGGDSGELVSEACVFGVPHPPGYPLLLLLSSATMRWLPWFHTLAAKANFVSVVCGAIAAGMLAACSAASARLGGASNASSRILGVALGLAFAFAPLTWTYSVGAEVFALNNVLGSVWLFMVLQVHPDMSFPKLCFSSFWAGVALTNQHTSVLYLAPPIAWVLWITRNRLARGHVAALAGCFVAGLVPYVVLVFNSARVTPGSWGDLTSLSGFLRHFLRSEYGSLQLSPSASAGRTSIGGMAMRLGAYISHSNELLPLLAFVLALVGIVVACRPSARWHAGFRVLAGTWLLYLVLFFFLANIDPSNPMAAGVLARFFMQADWLLVMWLGFAIGVGLAKASQTSFHTLGVVAITCGVAMWPIAAAVYRFPSMDHSVSGDVHALYGKALLDMLPQNSILLSHTDLNWNAVRYQQQCNGVRPDIVHLSTQMLPYPWFKRQHALFPNVSFPTVPMDASTDKESMQHRRDLARFCNANRDHPIFVDLHSVNDIHIGQSNVLEGTNLQLIPFGPLFQVMYKAQKSDGFASVDATQWWTESPAALNFLAPTIGRPDLSKYPPGTWEFAASSLYWDARYQRALYLVSYAIAAPLTARGKQAALESAHLLEDVYHASEGGWVFSYKLADLYKNTVLAQARAWMVTSDIAGQTQLAHRMVDIYERFLRENPKDQHAHIFSNVLDQVKAHLAAYP